MTIKINGKETETQSADLGQLAEELLHRERQWLCQERWYPDRIGPQPRFRMEQAFSSSKQLTEDDTVHFPPHR